MLTMRLIDADDLGVGRCSKDVFPAAYCAGWNGLLGLIVKAPTVYAVPVVRCYQCRSYNNPRLGWCSFHMDRENYDDFCSCGVRMDGDSYAKAD